MKRYLDCLRFVLPAAMLLGSLVAAAARARAGEENAAPEACPVEEKPFPAELAAIDAQWQITFRKGGTTLALPAAALVRWGICPEPRRGPLLVLADGSLVAADERLSAGKEKLTADTLLFGQVSIPLERLAGVVLRLPADPLQRTRLIDRAVSGNGLSDRVLLANGDEIPGTIRAIREGKAQVETGATVADVDLSRVEALLYNPALLQRTQASGLRAWAGFGDGTRLMASTLTLDARSVRVTLAGGLTWTAPPRDLVFLQPLGGHSTYLSDLVASYRHVPYLDLSWPYRNDRSVSGGMLRAGGRLYLKGLGVHSTSRLSYTLAEPYRRFEAELAVDNETGGRGSVAFRVFADGQLKYASPIIRGGAPPVAVRVDLAGAKRLDLVVDFAQRADELDHADWLDARLIR